MRTIMFSHDIYIYIYILLSYFKRCLLRNIDDISSIFRKSVHSDMILTNANWLNEKS